ncbi:VOC family protein [Roseibium aggregatum]|uniref:VOC family protein n=1 Tax=Roseibium aggregatum TaxID=187304 RepID=A0A939EED6_9HYPH|nr:VOC family protein [Roseibium aggregatum]MBN9671002.1 VOC family protein [Roseibium aggregatum]
MIELKDVVYCRLGTRDLDGAEWFATNILGLEVSERRRGATYFKSDERAHTLCYFEGDPEDQVTAFELGRGEDLQTAAATLEALNHEVHYGTKQECDARHVREFIRFQDPTGNAIEFVVRPETTGVNYHGNRDAGITGFSHVGLCTTDAARDEAFWTNVCNARVSDRIGDAPLMRLGTIHHSIALFPFHKAGIQHINHQVGGTDDIQRSFNFVRDNQVNITFGPGRHPTSTAEFLYFTGPEGMTFEYSTGVSEIHDEPLWRDRQFHFEPKGFCRWGAAPRIAAFDNGGSE